MKENGLELVRINSKVEKFKINDQIHALSLFNSEGFVVAYLHHKVLIGRVRVNNFEFFQNETFEEKYIQRLRLFNKERELLVWADQEGLKARLRVDTEGDETYAVDAYQVLWGTEKEELNQGWIRIFEQRGTELILPLKPSKIDNRKNRLFIKTRNYITFHPLLHQATYVDCRFVDFVEYGRNVL